jgi:hypothetical protein
LSARKPHNWTLVPLRKLFLHDVIHSGFALARDFVPEPADEEQAFIEHYLGLADILLRSEQAPRFAPERKKIA